MRDVLSRDVSHESVRRRRARRPEGDARARPSCPPCDPEPAPTSWAVDRLASLTGRRRDPLRDTSWHLRHLASFGLVRDSGRRRGRARAMVGVGRSRLSLAPPDRRDSEGQAAYRALGEQMFRQPRTAPRPGSRTSSTSLPASLGRLSGLANTRIVVTEAELAADRAGDRGGARAVRPPRAGRRRRGGSRGVRLCATSCRRPPSTATAEDAVSGEQAPSGGTRAFAVLDRRDALPVRRPDLASSRCR